jgi:hypothetical protein
LKEIALQNAFNALKIKKNVLFVKEKEEIAKIIVSVMKIL